MTDTPSTPDPTPAAARSPYLPWLLVAVLGGAVVGLVRVIRSSPCYQHGNDEAQIVETAKESARLRLAETKLPQPKVSEGEGATREDALGVPLSPAFTSPSEELFHVEPDGETPMTNGKKPGRPRKPAPDAA